MHDAQKSILLSIEKKKKVMAEIKFVPFLTFKIFFQVESEVDFCDASTIKLIRSKLLLNCVK